MIIRWTQPAEDDLAAIDEYWMGYSVASADTMLARIHTAADFLRGMPHGGPRIDEIAARKWTVRGTNCLIIYRIHDGQIEVLRVHHAAENWRALSG
jgi:plasmid stabilization system protein ParE